MTAPPRSPAASPPAPASTVCPAGAARAPAHGRRRRMKPGRRRRGLASPRLAACGRGRWLILSEHVSSAVRWYHAVSAHVLVVDDEIVDPPVAAGGADRRGVRRSPPPPRWPTPGAAFEKDRPDIVLLDLVLGRRQRPGPAAADQGAGRPGQGRGDLRARLVRARGERDEAGRLRLHQEAVRAGRGGRDGRQRRAHEHARAARRLSVRPGPPARRLAPGARVGGDARPRARRSTSSRPTRCRCCCCSARPAPASRCWRGTFTSSSGRAGEPLVELNCSAIPESLIESELFGHERGAFSDARERKLGLVEVADGGTLFLDEVGDLGPAAQAKLLTFLEQRTFRRVGRDVDPYGRRAHRRRHQPRPARDGGGAHLPRGSLVPPVGAFALRVPPLRERADDVAPLAQAFLADASRQYRRRWRGIADETLRLLRGYSWPGNVRELRAVMSRAALLHDDEVLRPEHLPPEIGAAVLARAAAAEPARERRRRPDRRSPRWRRSSWRTSAACWSCATATARWRRSTWTSRGRRWRASWAAELRRWGDPKAEGHDCAQATFCDPWPCR